MGDQTYRAYSTDMAYNVSCELVDLNATMGRIADALEAMVPAAKEQELTVAFERGEQRRQDRRELVAGLAHARTMLREFDKEAS